jgi:hypothetical protein
MTAPDMRRLPDVTLLGRRLSFSGAIMILFPDFVTRTDVHSQICISILQGASPL